MTERGKSILNRMGVEANEQDFIQTFAIQVFTTQRDAILPMTLETSLSPTFPNYTISVLTVLFYV